MKRITIIFLMMVFMVFGITACNNDSEVAESADPTEITAAPATGGSIKEGTTSGSSVSSEQQSIIPSGGLLTGKHHAKIKVKGYGTIRLVLNANKAPITVTNFVKLAEEGFYDGLTFHRVISSFMIQGGDPLGNGTGGSEETIKGEFSSNGVDNDISHVRGTISMARSSDPDSASSQFFIMHQDAGYLDGQYAAFGKVTKGIKVVDKICANTKVEDDNGTVADENQPIIESITIID